MNATSRALPRRGELFLLQAGAASIWLTTALGVLHPTYREAGPRVALPPRPARRTPVAHLRGRAGAGRAGAGAAAEDVARGRAGRRRGGLHRHPRGARPDAAGAPVRHADEEPPLIALVVATWLAAREGFTPRAWWTLRVGVALLWVTEGLFPTIVFQQPLELDVVAKSGLVPMSPSTFLVLLGLVQAASGLLALTLRGRWLVALLAARVALETLPARDRVVPELARHGVVPPDRAPRAPFGERGRTATGVAPSCALSPARRGPRRSSAPAQSPAPARCRAPCRPHRAPPPRASTAPPWRPRR